MTEQAQLFNRRMNRLDEFMQREQLEPIYAHTDMLLLVIYAYHTALGTRTLCQEMDRQLDLNVYTRYHLHHWQSKIASWQQQLREVPTFNISDKAISEKRSKRLAKLFSALTNQAEEQFNDLTIDDIKGDFLPDASEMTFGAIILRLNQTLSMLQSGIDQLIRLPQTQNCQVGEALQRYIENPDHYIYVQEERIHCQRYFAQKKNRTNERLLLYLRERLQALMGHSALGYVSLSANEQEAIIQQFVQTCYPEELLFPDSQGVPSSKHPLADRELVSRLLYFLDLTDGSAFPKVDAVTMVEYLTNNDFRDYSLDERNLVRLMALLQELQPIASQLRQSSVAPTAQDPSREHLYQLICKNNLRLRKFLVKGHTLDEFNHLFHQWIYAECDSDRKELQQQLCDLLRDGNCLKLKYYCYLLHEASDRHRIICRDDYEAIYQAIDPALFGYADRDKMPTSKSFQHYLSDGSHYNENKWQDVKPYVQSF